ncbi:hypothetical protein [Tenacibaculum finnmarkense]|uniref:hypothetical protein n=1 Tax=Tenacibaculum finnmarkense TaxID=2781243 RepID=UPI001EFA319F|nr:hypothetical protein [Tenacibaculum finnmarkense]MCG8226383.1 hypothetical protein [Tenacibaculum finnmarkense genomovar finnmarkense]
MIKVKIFVNIFMFLVFFVSKSYAQTVVTDPGLYGILIANNRVHKGALSSIKSEQTKIRTLKTKITLLTANINRIQTKVLESLTKVQSVVRDGKNVINAGLIAKDIGNYQAMAFEIAKEDPTLVLIAYKMEYALTQRTFDLGTFIVSALKGGEGNMMSNMERTKIINRVVDELKSMRGIVYGIWIRMKYARLGNKWKAIATEHKIDLFLLDDFQRNRIIKDLKIW